MELTSSSSWVRRVSRRASSSVLRASVRSRRIRSIARLRAVALLRLQERPVGDEGLAVSDAHDACLRRIVELEAVPLDALLSHPFQQRVPPWQLLFSSLLRFVRSQLAPVGPHVRGVVQQEEVLHAASSSRPARSSIAPVEASTSCDESSAASSRLSQSSR